VLDADNDGAAALVLRNVSSGAETTVLPASTQDYWRYEQPELTPDGSKVVVASDFGDRTNYVVGLVRVNRNGTGAVRLTNPPPSSETTTTYTEHFDASPSVRSDGTVLFVRTTCVFSQTTDDVSCTGRLHTVPVAGGTVCSRPVQLRRD